MLGFFSNSVKGRCLIWITMERNDKMQFVVGDNYLKCFYPRGKLVTTLFAIIFFCLVRTDSLQHSHFNVVCHDSHVLVIRRLFHLHFDLAFFRSRTYLQSHSEFQDLFLNYVRFFRIPIYLMLFDRSNFASNGKSSYFSFKINWCPPLEICICKKS